MTALNGLSRKAMFRLSYGIFALNKGYHDTIPDPVPLHNRHDWELLVDRWAGFYLKRRA